MEKTNNFQERFERWKNGESYWDIVGRPLEYKPQDRLTDEEEQELNNYLDSFDEGTDDYTMWPNTGSMQKEVQYNIDNGGMKPNQFTQYKNNNRTFFLRDFQQRAQKRHPQATPQNVTGVYATTNMIPGTNLGTNVDARYNSKYGTISVANPSIDTIAHEYGHAMDERLDLSNPNTLGGIQDVNDLKSAYPIIMRNTPADSYPVKEMRAVNTSLRNRIHQDSGMKIGDDLDKYIDSMSEDQIRQAIDALQTGYIKGEDIHDTDSVNHIKNALKNVAMNDTPTNGVLYANIGKSVPGYTDGKAATPVLGSKEKFVRGMYYDLYNTLEEMKLPTDAVNNMVKQLVHESDWGGSNLARRNRNYAGIKKSDKVYRSYKDNKAFIRDYINVLNNGRYRGIFKAASPNTYAAILKNGGYYEDSLEHYANSLNNMRTVDSFIKNARKAGIPVSFNPDMYKKQTPAQVPIYPIIGNETTPYIAPVQSVNYGIGNGPQLAAPISRDQDIYGRLKSTVNLPDIKMLMDDKLSMPMFNDTQLQ